MATLIESPRVAFVSGSRLPVSPPFSLSRLALPLLCVSLGVFVGTATGLALAIVNARNNALAASSDSVEASDAPAANLAMNASPAHVNQPAVRQSTPAASPASTPTVESRPAKLNHAVANVNRTATAPSKLDVALTKSPDALKPATFKLDGKKYHVAKLMLLPAADPERHEAEPAQPAVSTTLNTAQWSLDAPAPASLYTEGDLTVSDYSASTRTIQTSDGKTFVLGTTVAAANATSWETYRSDVHYMCDQNGSCVLMRAGVVAPSARLI